MEGDNKGILAMTLQQAQWAAQRVLFYAYIFFSLFTIIGGWITAPLMSYLFLGDWRFWRHLRLGFRLWLHMFKFLGPLIRWENKGFMFSLPLAAPPFTAPNRAIVQLSSSWEYGNSCGGCSRCCDKIACPILDKERKLCTGYNSFFWRHFNCGRFPSEQREINYYGCPKWVMRPSPLGARIAVQPQPAAADQGPEGLSID